MAILFPAAGSRVSRANAFLSMAANFTVVGWVRNVGENPDPGTHRVYWLRGDPTLVSSAITLRSGTSNDRAIYLDVWNGATTVTTDPSYPQPLDTWIAVAVTYESIGHVVTLWVGGVIAGTVTVNLSGLVFGVMTEQLGADATPSWPDIGAAYWLEAQRLYTEADLVAQWSSATAVSATNLLAFTPLTDPTHLQDDSGNGRDWTAAGPALTQMNILPISPTLPFTANAQFTAPSAADSAVLVPNATAYVSSDWVTLIPTTEADILITGIVVKTDALNTYVNCEFDLGMSHGGPVSLITTFTGTWASTFYDSPGVLPHVIPLDGVFSGATVWARMRKSNTTTTPWGIRLQYFNKPILGSLFTTAVPQQCFPSAAAGTLLTIGASAWADSTRTEIVSSTLSPWIIVGLVPNVISLDIAWEVTLEIGPPGSETPLTTIRFHHTGIANTDGPGVFPFYRPLAIPAGSRLSAVTRRSPAVGSSVIALKLLYHQGPL